MDNKMGLKQTIGEQVKKRRTELRMEQVDLQDYAEVGSTTLSKLEQGKANITVETLEKILEVLGLEIVVKVKG
jgi:transcriptional regulator with XRE-family HTH domain